MCSGKSNLFVILAAFFLIWGGTLSGCGAASQGAAGDVETQERESTLSQETASAGVETPAEESTLSREAPSPEEEAAKTAFTDFLSGNDTILNSEQQGTWWIPDFQDETLAYEYAYWDLNGDGVPELLVQMKDDPAGYNGVFHFEDGKITCWNSDASEMQCRDYPLDDGTMVRQYDFNGTTTYTIFRYQDDGEMETVQSLFLREELIPEDSTEPCPYYEVDGQEVDQEEFHQELDALIESRLLPRSAWSAI